MLVIFVEPSFPANQREFVRGLKQVGATVVAIGESPKEQLDSQLQDWLLDYVQVPSVCDVGAMTQAVRFIQSKIYVDRLEATVEAHILPVAEVRRGVHDSGDLSGNRHALQGQTADEGALAATRSPLRQTLGSGDRGAIFEFARRVGYPLIVKPRAGAGASGATRVDSDDQLAAA